MQITWKVMSGGQSTAWGVLAQIQSAVSLLAYPWWDGNENQKKVKPISWDKSSLIIKVKYNSNKSNNNSNGKADKRILKAKRNKWCTVQLITNQWLMLSPSLYSEHPSQPIPLCLYTDLDVQWYGISLWPAQVTHPGRAPSHVHLFVGRAWKTEKSLT